MLFRMTGLLRSARNPPPLDRETLFAAMVLFSYLGMRAVYALSSEVL